MLLTTGMTGADPSFTRVDFLGSTGLPVTIFTGTGYGILFSPTGSGFILVTLNGYEVFDHDGTRWERFSRTR